MVAFIIRVRMIWRKLPREDLRSTVEVKTTRPKYYFLAKPCLVDRLGGTQRETMKRRMIFKRVQCLQNDYIKHSFGGKVKVTEDIVSKISSLFLRAGNICIFFFCPELSDSLVAKHIVVALQGPILQMTAKRPFVVIAALAMVVYGVKNNK